MAYKLGKLDASGKLEALSSNVKLIQGVLLALIITLMFTLSGLFMDSFARKQASYENLQNEIQAQNTKIDNLTHELEIQRMQDEMRMQIVASPTLK